jgi:hypothetical protein
MPNSRRSRGSLHEELNGLQQEKNPYKRAKGFEVFLVRLLEKESLRVTRDPRAANPRQTDLAAEGDMGSFLVEAKWTKKKIGVADISQVRDRLGRVPLDMFACVFSVGGFSEPARHDVCRDKSRGIYLFNDVEIRGIVEGSLTFQELLDHKKTWLRIHSSAFLFDEVPAPSNADQLRSEPDIFQISGAYTRLLRNRTLSNDIVFSNEFLDFTRRHAGSVFSLQLQPSIDNLHDLKRLLNLLQGWFGLSGQGPFSIRQSGTGWFGYGMELFLSAIEQRQERYDELKWESYHHSEELAYLDSLGDGGLIGITSRQSTGTNYLHSTFLEIYFPGMPVDMSNVRRLCRATRNEEAHLELVGTNPLYTCSERLGIEVHPVGTIVSNCHGHQSVSGLVVKNPFLNKPIPSIEEEEFSRFVHLIHDSEFLLCSLRDWHNPGTLMKTYRLTSLEACWIEHFCVFHLLCDWD